MLNQIKNQMYKVEKPLLNFLFKGMYTQDDVNDEILNQIGSKNVDYRLYPFLHSKYVYDKYSDFREDFDKASSNLKRVHKKLRTFAKDNNIYQVLQTMLKEQDTIRKLYDFNCKAESYIASCNRKPVYQDKLKSKINPISLKIQEIETIILSVLFKLNLSELGCLMDDPAYKNYKELLMVVSSFVENNPDATLDTLIKYCAEKDSIEEFTLKSGYAKSLDYDAQVELLNQKLNIANELAVLQGYKSKLAKESKNLNTDMIYRLSVNNMQDIKLSSFVSMENNEVLRLCKKSLYYLYGLDFTKLYDKPFKKGYVYYAKGYKPYTEFLRDSSAIRLTGLDDLSSAVTLAHEMGHYLQFIGNNDNIILNVRKHDYFEEVIPTLNEIAVFEEALRQYANNNKVYYLVLLTYYKRLYNKLIITSEMTEFEMEVLKLLDDTNYEELLEPRDVDRIWNKYLGLNSIGATINNLKIADNFANVSYLYGLVIAMRIYDNISKDDKYAQKVIDFMNVSQNLTFEEKLKYFDIDIDDFTLEDNAVRKAEQLFFNIKKIELANVNNGKFEKGREDDNVLVVHFN